MPLLGSVQKFGDTCSDELRLVFRLSAMSFAVRPNWVARARSIWAKNSGALTSCCRCTSATPGMAAIRSPQLLGDAQILVPIVADGAHVDLRRDAEVEDLRHHVGGLEIEYALREGRRQHLAQFADVVRGRSVVLLQRDQNHAVIDADRRAVAEGVIVGTGRQADIVDDQVALVLAE